MMQHIVNELSRDISTATQFPISQKQYQEWATGFIFDGLRSQRYGQSFCNHFKIHDNILFYCLTADEADRYILENYVDNSDSNQID